jgi:perosamine synthetase
VTTEFIPQMIPWFGNEEADAVSDYMRSGGWITEFKQTETFENMIAAFTGSKHCIVTNNGTISLTLAAIAAGIEAGDDVIVPNYTQIATPNSVLMIGANPVFVDVEAETLCLDIERVREAITPKTKAISLVAANGRYPKAGIAAFEALSITTGGTSGRLARLAAFPFRCPRSSPQGKAARLSPMMTGLRPNCAS